MKKIMLISIFVVLFAGIVNAQSTPLVDERQENQRALIRQGAASGEVTRAEAAKLRSEQRRIKRAERRAKADGEVSRKERMALHRKQNHASRTIRREKHDAQDRQ